MQASQKPLFEEYLFQWFFRIADFYSAVCHPAGSGSFVLWRTLHGPVRRPPGVDELSWSAVSTLWDIPVWFGTWDNKFPQKQFRPSHQIGRVLPWRSIMLHLQSRYQETSGNALPYGIK
jgi:hypothetical protein